MTTVIQQKTPYVGIRFQKLGKLYHFKVGSNQDVTMGDYVLVETKRGQVGS